MLLVCNRNTNHRCPTLTRGTYVFGMIRDAAKHTKKGKGSIQALVAATLQVEDEQILLDRWLPKESAPSNNLKDPVYGRFDVLSAEELTDAKVQTAA